MKTSLLFVLFVLLSGIRVLAQTKSDSLNRHQENTQQKNALFIDLFPLMEEVRKGKIDDKYILFKHPSESFLPIL